MSEHERHAHLKSTYLGQCSSPPGHMNHGSHPSSMRSPSSFNMSHSPLVAHPPPATSSPLSIVHNVVTSMSQANHMSKGLHMSGNSMMSNKGMVPNGLTPWGCNPMLNNAFSMFGGMHFPGYRGPNGDHPFDKPFPFGMYAGGLENGLQSAQQPFNPKKESLPNSSFSDSSPVESDKKEDTVVTCQSKNVFMFCKHSYWRHTLHCVFRGFFFQL